MLFAVSNRLYLCFISRLFWNIFKCVLKQYRGEFGSINVHIFQEERTIV